MFRFNLLNRKGVSSEVLGQNFFKPLKSFIQINLNLPSVNKIQTSKKKNNDGYDKIFGG